MRKALSWIEQKFSIPEYSTATFHYQHPYDDLITYSRFSVYVFGILSRMPKSSASLLSMKAFEAFSSRSARS